jgi:hypothetical protein
MSTTSFCNPLKSLYFLSDKECPPGLFEALRFVETDEAMFRRSGIVCVG